MVNLAQGLHVLKALLYSCIFFSSQVIFILLIWIFTYCYSSSWKSLLFNQDLLFPSSFLLLFFLIKKGSFLFFLQTPRLSLTFIFFLVGFISFFTFHTLIEDFGLSWLFKQTNAQKRIYKLAFRDTFSSVGSNEDHNQHRLIWCKEDSTPL